MKVKFFSLALLFLFSLSGFSQALDKSQTLYVVLHAQNQSFVDKLTRKNKTEKLQAYLKLINEYNTNIKEAVAKYLTYFTKIEYKTDIEVEALKKDELKKVYLLVHSFALDMGTGAGGGWGWTENKLETVKLDTTNRSEYTIVEIRAWDKSEKEMAPVRKKDLATLYCSKADIFFAIRQLNGDCAGPVMSSTKKSDLLKSKTLVINKEDLDKDLTEADIKKNYPYEFKIVNKSEFDQYILKEDKSKVCLMVLPIAKGAAPMGFVVKVTILYFHYFYDPATNDLVYASTKLKGGAYGGGNEKITKKSFETYLKE